MNKYYLKYNITNFIKRNAIDITQYAIWILLCMLAIYSLNKASVYEAKYTQCEELTRELLFGVALEEE